VRALIEQVLLVIYEAIRVYDNWIFQIVQGWPPLIVSLTSAKVIRIKNHPDIVVNTNMRVPECFDFDFETLAIFEGDIYAELFRLSLE
jgi:hypothetical protein